MRRLAAGVLAGILVAVASAAAADSKLADAAMARDYDTVAALLASGADVNAAQGDGTTALHWAAYHGDAAIVRTLLAAGARVTARTRIGDMSPLYMAARRGSAPAISALLDAGADAREANTNGTTVLMVAAGAGDPEAVRVLVDHGAEVNAVEFTNGQTALMFAAARGSVDAIQMLLEHGADPDVRTRVFRLGRVEADENGNPLPEAGDPPPAAAGAPTAAQQQALAARREERVLGAKTVGGMSALHFAAREGHLDAVQALAAGGADLDLPNAGDRTPPMTEAIINGHLDIARFLLERGADPTLANADGLTPLYATVDVKWRANAWYPQPTIAEERTGYLEFMGQLIDHGADVDARLGRKLWYRKYRYGDDWADPNGATAFWRAAQANDVAAMRLLIARGADPTIATVHGVTPLLVAGGLGFEYQLTNIAPDARLAAVSYLVEELGADVRAKDELDYTVLHGAAYVGDNEVINYLAMHGADPTARAKGRLGGTQGAVPVAAGEGDTVADMANGPREKSLLHPESVRLLEAMGSANSNDCRSTACVNNTKPEKAETPKPPKPR
ncbi:MAG: ankyrin repeat domain-containing protein [Vicinamibacterales bacterium]